MNWIDANRFQREEGEKYGMIGYFWFTIKAILVGFTIIGIPFMVYFLLDIMGTKTSRYLKKHINDVEDTHSQVKIIKTIDNKFGLMWWKNPNQCKILEKAIYEDVVRCDDELFILKQNGKYGIHSWRVLKVPLQYDYLKYIDKDKFAISPYNDRFINSHGERL